MNDTILFIDFYIKLLAVIMILAKILAFGIKFLADSIEMYAHGKTYKLIMASIFIGIPLIIISSILFYELVNKYIEFALRR